MRSSFVNVFVKTIDGGTSTAKKSSSKALVISQADQRVQSTLTAEKEDSKLEQCTSCNRTANFLHLLLGNKADVTAMPKTCLSAGYNSSDNEMAGIDSLCTKCTCKSL